MSEEWSTRIVNVFIPWSGVLVQGDSHMDYIFKLYYISLKVVFYILQKTRTAGPISNNLKAILGKGDSGLFK